MGFLKKIRNKIIRKKQQDVVIDKIQEVRKSNTEKYEKAFSKSRESFTKKIQKFVTKNREVNEVFFEELEELLITSDMGISYTMSLIEKLKVETKIKRANSPEEINEIIFETMFGEYINGDEGVTNIKLESEGLNVVLVIGVNGVGKTTSIGKLAKRFTDEGKKVSLAAADTFRAGAVDQLAIWAERTGVSIVTPERQGQDPASVVYKGIERAKEEKVDILFVDTAGRLQNKKNLMFELEKINKIIFKAIGKFPIETLLVIDATTGQSGVQQAKSFNDVTKLTGIILTKMDSSSRGGIILSIKQMFNIPVKFIGLGESLDDLEKFELDKYIYGLTADLNI